MLEGLRTSAAGMLPRTVQQEIIANNLANVNTTGYKRDRLVFRQTLDAELAAAVESGQQPVVQELVTDFTQGPLEQTHRPLDLAIQGEGFFVVRTATGERYTRAGNFQLDAEGTLVTVDGDPVLGESGPIVLDQSNFEVRPNGEVWQKGVLIDRIRLVTFDDLTVLNKEGRGLFRLSDPNAQPRVAEKATVKQGYLEGSNVNPLEEMVEMITVLRNFEAEQKAIQTQDQTLSRAVNDLSRF